MASSLIALVAAPGVGDELLPVEKKAGVAVGLLDGNLVPRAVSFAPVGGGPAGVEVVQCLVLGLEPLLELRARLGAEIFAVVFVVDLPANDVGVVAEALGKFGGDDAAELAVFRVREVELLAIAVLILASIGVGAESFGVLLREPCGRRGGGSADDDGDVVLLGEAYGVLKPIELEVALGGLHGGPGELADAGEVHVRLLHEGEVGFPTGFGPLLGVPGGAEFEWDFVGRGWKRLLCGDVEGGKRAGGGEECECELLHRVSGDRELMTLWTGRRWRWRHACGSSGGRGGPVTPRRPRA